MGFKFKKFTYNGQQGSWGPTSTGVSRGKSVLTDFANWLINDSDTGWELDTNRSASTTDYTSIQCWNPANSANWTSQDEDFAPALFFVNSISGCKLFLSAHGGGKISATSSYCIKIPNSDICVAQNTNISNVYGYQYVTGIMMSMIPGDSNDEFGYIFDGTTQFIPNSGTKLIATCLVRGKSMSSNSGTTLGPYMVHNANTYTYNYGLLATPYCIGVIGSSYTTGSTFLQWNNGTFCGRIFGTLAHNETLPQSKYGCIAFNYYTGSDTPSEFAHMLQDQYSVGGVGSVYFNGTSVSNYSTFYSDINTSANYGLPCQFFGTDGHPIMNSASCNMRIQPSNVAELSSRLINTSTAGFARWTPYAVGAVSTNLTQDGVVPGDGFKGYLDTDLFRASVVHDVGRTYDNGNFIGVNSMLLGWDPDNESL